MYRPRAFFALTLASAAPFTGGRIFRPYTKESSRPSNQSNPAPAFSLGNVPVSKRGLFVGAKSITDHSPIRPPTGVRKEHIMLDEKVVNWRIEMPAQRFGYDSKVVRSSHPARQVWFRHIAIRFRDNSRSE